MKSTERFSSRVENYVRYRPGYPRAVLELLQRECRLTPASVIADIGSGTGILSKLFLQDGNLVFGVEPNREMRLAGEAALQDSPNWRSIDATAESTSLPNGSIDLIIAGQAFHWFDRARARQEFRRILKPGGWVAIVWNHRRLDSTPFLREYEGLLTTWGIDYQEVADRYEDAGSFFEPGTYRRATFDNFQDFDWDALQGRVLSSSYTPEPGHPHYQPLIDGLRRLFHEHRENGKVRFEYDTIVYFGRFPT